MYFISRKKFIFCFWFNTYYKKSFVNFIGKIGLINFKISFNYYLPYFFVNNNNLPLRRDYYFITYSKKFIRSFFSFFKNSILGVSSGYFRYIDLKGVGFKVLYSSDFHSLYFFLGYNNITSYKLPSSVRVKIRKQQILLFSYDNSILSYVCYEIKSLRFPDPYRGKGVLFREEILTFKPGKQRL
jgi:ribosomal protein L6P/L9E